MQSVGAMGMQSETGTVVVSFATRQLRGMHPDTATGELGCDEVVTHRLPAGQNGPACVHGVADLATLHSPAEAAQEPLKVEPDSHRKPAWQLSAYLSILLFGPSLRY